MDQPRTASARRWLLIVVAVAVVAVVAAVALPVARFMVTQVIGRVTVVTDADGTERTIHWREYPGVAGVDPQEVLNGPTAEEAYAAGEAMVLELRAELTKELDLDWMPEPAGHDDFDPFHDRVQNWFGGASMLTTINGHEAQATSVPTTFALKQRALDIIAEVTARHGYSPPVFDHDRWSAADRLESLGGSTPQTQVIISGIVEGPTGQWLMFALQDLTKDAAGRFHELRKTLTENGWPLNTISFVYGANALLHESDREEFERRLQPFLGLTPPPPLET